MAGNLGRMCNTARVHSLCMLASLPRNISTSSTLGQKTADPLAWQTKLANAQQGDKVFGVFTKQEYTNRIAKLRAYMAKHDIGACVLTSIQNVTYFGGYLYCSFGRPYGFVVTPDRSVTISAHVDGGRGWRRCEGENIVYTDWQRDNFCYAVKNELANVQGNVGCEFDHLTVDRFKQLDAALPTNPKVNVGESTMYIRMIKSQEEIAMFRQAARITEIAGVVAVDAIHEGVPEYEVALASTATLVREIAKTYPDSEYTDSWSLIQTGINTDSAHNSPTSRRVQKGDIISLNCFAVVAGYYVALERTMFFDHATEEALRYWELNLRVHKRGVQLIKPGKRCCDIANELNEIFREAGMLHLRSIGYGHSFGVLNHYYGREAALEFREDTDTVLQPDMVVSMEPMITVPLGQPGSGGYREHDILVLHENNAENITRFPLGPEHNIIKK